MIDYETINYVAVLCCMYGIDDIRPRREKKKDSVTFFIEAMDVITVSRRSRKISLSRRSDRLEM